MQILSIHLKNIKSHHDTELSFSSGINVLSGPNGAGKSTVFEAIGYALFGVDARDFVSNIDRFLSIGAKRGEISVVFQTSAGDIWKVSRTVGTPAKWLLHRESGGSFEVEEHARIEETEARITELLELDNGRPLAEQFKLVIGPFQNEFLGPFIIKQATRRQEAFDEILGIDAWRKTYKGTGSLLTAIKSRVDILGAEIAGKQEQLVSLPDKISELETIGRDLMLRQQEVTAQDTLLAGLDMRLTELEAVEKSISTLSNECQLLENRLVDGTGKIEEQKRRIGESQQSLEIVTASRAGTEAYDRVEITLAGLRQKEQQRRTVEQEIVVLEREALTLAQTLEHERAEIGKTETQLGAEQDKLAVDRHGLLPDPQLTVSSSRLPEIRMAVEGEKGTLSLLSARRESLLEGEEKLAAGVCPFFQEQCKNIAGSSAPSELFRARTADLASQAARVSTQLSELTLLLKDAEGAEKELIGRAIRLQELDKQSAALEARRVKNRERAEALEGLITQQAGAAQLVTARMENVKGFADLDAAIVRAEQERQQHQQARDAYTANLNVAMELESRRQHLQKMEQLLDRLTADLKTRQTELATRTQGFQPELLHAARQEKEQLVAGLATLRQQIIDLVRTRERLEKERAALKLVQEDSAAKQLEINSFSEKEMLVKFLRNQVFKNVSARLSERFREEISLRADRIYRTIAETDEELYWGENYQIVLRDMQGGGIRERSDDQLSGGQTMSAVVALRLALLQTIGARIAFFDEPTSNLDAARRENLAHAFRAIDVGREEVTEHWYDQLFLISHDVAFTEITDQMLQVGGS